MKRKALVILSGGQDSTTCLFWAKKNFDEVSAITFDYGQLHISELKSAIKVAKIAGVNWHEVVKVPNVLQSMSPLTNKKEQLHKYSDFDSMEREVGSDIENTFVPLRNPFFLIISANYALSMGYTHIVTGVCASDNANYPDCTQAFIEKCELMINEAIGNKFSVGLKSEEHNWLRIETPLIDIDKSNTCWLARKLGRDSWRALAYTTTSYDGVYPPIDNNHSNLLRAKAFEQAGLPDPLVIRAWQEGLMDLPVSSNYHCVTTYMLDSGSMHPMHYTLDELLECAQ
ncbi:7-cyano-7-deazaguanine synthase [Vibrio phage vB_VibM_83AMN]|nr:7-cyano-7-deazaguanine synthase [Vibrio phage vB_VibM_83AMN]